MKIAIYSRKSKFTSKGESIKSQIQMCKNYAKNHFENIEEFIIYEDEGFSGGNIDRPQFKLMMSDAKDKKFNILICYRLDRISRNVSDFSSTIEKLNNYNISFVSIREQFDTSTPMGRAMMYIASVFAQLERETIAERIKDNMLQLAKTGRWLGGVPSLGFESEKKLYIDKDCKERSLTKLTPIKKEMELVEFFYNKYLELGSIHKLRKYLIQNNYKTRKSKYYSSRTLSDILRNPVYVKADKDVVEYLEDKNIEVAGKENLNDKKAILIYNKVNKKGRQNEYSDWIAAIAKHEGSIESKKWLEVQYKLDKNRMDIPRKGTSEIALLSGILKCKKCGSSMNVMYGSKRKDGTAPHYYVCNLKTISGMDKCNNPNANGADIDYTVINKILSLAKNKDTLLSKLKELRKKDSSTNDTDILNKLNNKKKMLLDEIEILVNELPKSPTASKYILPQIEAKDKEVKELEKEISKLENNKNKVNKEKENLDFVIGNIINFSKIVNTLDNEQKKYFIQTIVDKVYWEGEKEEVGIKLFTNKDIESSKFHTTSSCERYKTGILLYSNLKNFPKYEDYPENTLGERIRKQRFIKGLTAEELGSLCECSPNTIYCYESGTAIPNPATMKKIVKALNIKVEYFNDDYYNFIFSPNYTSYLKKWRKDNIKNINDIEKKLDITYVSYLQWEKGDIMSRKSFNKIKDKLGF